MQELDPLPLTQNLICTDFALDAPKSALTEEDLVQFLAPKLERLLVEDPEKLFFILYRLDVDEPAVHRVLSGQGEELPSVALARLIVAREKQKAITRLLYS
jgi:hypothetical protein